MFRIRHNDIKNKHNNHNTILELFHYDKPNFFYIVLNNYNHYALRSFILHVS